MSLGALRNFFGDEDYATIAKSLAHMPAYQLLELADRLLESNRGTPFFGAVHDLSQCSDAPYISDRLTDQWSSGQVKSGDTSLKHLVLYCKNVIVPDPLLGWAHDLIREYEDYKRMDTHAARDISMIVKRLSPLARLVEVGSISMFPPFAILGSDTGRVRPRPVGGLGLTPKDEIRLRPQDVWLSHSSRLLDEADPDDDRADVFFNNYQRWLNSGEARVWEDEQSYYETLNARELLDLDTHELDSNLEFSETWASNRFLASLIIEECCRMISADLKVRGLDAANQEDWSDIIFRASEVDDFDSQITSAEIKRLRELVGVDASVPVWSLQRLVDFALFSTKASVVPVCHDNSTSRLLQSVSENMLHGLDGTFEFDEMLPAAAFEVPSLSKVSLEDIVALRASEEIFDEVRSALSDLQAECVRNSLPADWTSYQIAVNDMANDIVGPTYGRLKRMLTTRSALATLVGAATSGLTKLGVGAIATSLGLPTVGSGAASAPAGQVAKNTVRRKVHADDLKTACSILVELVDT